MDENSGVNEGGSATSDEAGQYCAILFSEIVSVVCLVPSKTKWQMGSRLFALSASFIALGRQVSCVILSALKIFFRVAVDPVQLADWECDAYLARTETALERKFFRSRAVWGESLLGV